MSTKMLKATQHKMAIFISNYFDAYDALPEDEKIICKLKGEHQYFHDLSELARSQVNARLKEMDNKIDYLIRTMKEGQQ